MKPLHEFTATEFGDVVDTNLRGVFFAMKHQIPHMIAKGGGTILVTSSTVANTTAANRTHSPVATSARRMPRSGQRPAFRRAGRPADCASTSNETTSPS